MTLTFTLTGKCSVLTVSYFPAVDWGDGDYELDLTDFETYYTLANLNFDMFRKAYRFDSFEMLLNVLSFIEKGPSAVIDCLRQNESFKSATVDVRIEFDCKENVPANTTAYCLIIHDRVIEYCSLSNVVLKIM
ncbi:hypothetical protein ALC57_09066 [Trachymyrmex cornetzi]|uniref:Double jelly roll-like domain-containing protein n=1 Tax=Trachymyrmex cornetzi TaxID=471704 RepID=A0A151J5X1_9HYME|nr:hypothetical protein ALC57_09066 [Trachymyrmex cornetzi]